MDIRKKKIKGIIIVSLLIIACFCMASVIAVFIPNKTADAIYDLSSCTNIGELLSKDYATREDKMIFNSNNLDLLYKQLTGTATYDKVLELSEKTLNGDNFRTNNNGKDITVTINGLIWNATYLSRNRDGDPIVTLWLANSNQLPAAYKTAKWNDYTTDSNGTYPANMYGTSKIRAVTLNNGGKYATSVNTLSEVEQDSNNPFAIYTMSEIEGSLTSFIETPSNVAWQETELSKTYNDFPYNFNNDRYSTATPSNLFNNIDYSKKTNYSIWSEDKIWIPSMTEVGWADDSIIGMWRTNVNQRANDTGVETVQINSWSRSAYFDHYGRVRTNVPDGTSGSNRLVDSDFAVRPAFHLNLRKAEEATNAIAVPPTTGECVYNGDVIDITQESWYTEHLKKYVDVSYEYFKVGQDVSTESGTTVTQIKNAGIYKVKFSIKDPTMHLWKGGGSVKTMTYTVKQKSLGVNFNADANPPTALPTGLCSSDSSLQNTILRIRYTDGKGYDAFVPPAGIDVYMAKVEINSAVSENYVLDREYYVKYIALPGFLEEQWHVYNGSEQTYYLDYGNAEDKDEIEIIIPEEYKDKISYTDPQIKVKSAGKYKVELHLAKTDGSVRWSSRDTDVKTLEFEIKRSPLGIEISGEDGGALEVMSGENAKIIIDSLDNLYGSDVLDVNIVAVNSRSDAIRMTVYENLRIEAGAFPIEVELNTQQLSTGEWRLEYEAVGSGNNNADYEVEIENGPVILEVKGAETESGIRWTFKRDGKSVGTYTQMTGDKSVVYDKAIVYNGSEVVLEVRAPRDYSVDESWEDKGYKNAKGRNAGEYTTQVALKKGNERIIYSIEWKIDKGLFDLTDVKWKGDGKVQYTGDTVYAELENLPDGLIASYTNNDGLNVGDGGTVIVTFSLEGEYNDNYELPVKGGKDVNYICDGDTDFEWSKSWEVVKAEIGLEWTGKEYTDNDGNIYKIPVLTDLRAEYLVEYEYYETDSNGKIIDGKAPITLEEIEYSGTERKWYVAYPKLTDESNYAFPEGVESLYSPFFAVGGGTTSVTVSLESNKIEYNGKPRNVKLKISSGATLKDLTLMYYTGDVVNEANKLDGAPTERGNYLVVITSNKNSVVLSGTTQYTFEIIAATIKKEWNKDAKPYVLNLKYGQIDGIEYEIADAEGNRVEYSQLSAGNKYQIKAVIKEEMRNNYSFTDGTYETAWEEFELRAEDIANMQDPNDPNNTHYPQNEEDNEPDDNNPSGDINSGNEPGGDGSALDELLKKLKELPLWQLIASFVSIILIIIFMSKGFGYASKAKQSKKLAQSKFKEYYAGTFLGLAFGGWTAIACVLMGLAVLSLVFMILEKNRYNKAVFAYEEAKDDFERHRETNRREYDDNRREEEYRRREEDDRRRDEEYRRRDEEYRQREEDMKAMFMRMMGGYDFNNMGQPQGAYMGAQQGIGAEEIRGIVSETVTALLPGMQQALPQQASVNDEMVKSLIEEQKAMREMIKQLADKSTEKIIEKEVVATISNDETIKQMLSNQEKLMEKILELSANQPQQIIAAQPQVIEKIVEKPVEKIVEVPVEKPIVISTEAVGEAEKSKQVKKTPSPKKAPAPRLTLEEAYAKLTKEQKKYFDGLREYAMSKDSKCKEKLSTYFTTIGPSTTNPFIKLTIKKGITVALFKMEDEYLKDIRRNASGDGTKIKVKETEMPIGDKQAYDTAKDMVDLRIDQIDRYNDFLKEQRALRK